MTSTSKFTRSSTRAFLPNLDERTEIRQAMQDCRALTLSLFEGISHDQFCHQAHSDFSPVGWHLGHIAYTEALWLLQRCAGQAPIFSEYHRLFAQDGLPKGDRVHLPSLSEICHYLEEVRSRVFDYLAIAPLDQQERLWRWLLQHESQHAETVTLILELQKRDGLWKANETSLLSLELTPPVTVSVNPTEMICIPAGYFQQGNQSLEALDNERPVQSVYLETYWIDRTPVTCAEYRSFIQAGGYQDARWWSDEGWQWVQKHSLSKPLYWSGSLAHEDHPVCGVSCHEAEAYARFVGKRLPTEAEWEKAASWNPSTQQRSRYPWGDDPLDATRCNHRRFCGTTSAVDLYSNGQSYYGCYDLLGNVWEWTASEFAGYPEFESYPYSGYSQAYFDGAHRVLKGGSWATYPWALRSAFRNWYHPTVRQIFAGFRCVQDAEPSSLSAVT